MSNRPIKEFQLGPVKAAVWKNDAMANVTLTKSYKDRSGEWKTSNSFGPNDVPAAILCLQAAAKFLMSMPRTASSDLAPPEPQRMAAPVPRADEAPPLDDDDIPF